MTDEEWELIADLVGHYWVAGGMGRPPKVDRRRVVDAIFYVAATGCQWRALPAEYPNWNTVHRQHLIVVAGRDLGTDRPAPGRSGTPVREGRDAEPSAGIVDARSVRGASTVTGETRGYDAGKKISGRKTFGIVDTLGLLLAVCRGGRQHVGQHRRDRPSLTGPGPGRRGSARLWCDSGFKATFIKHCRDHHVGVEVVNRIHPHQFVVLPKRWIVERTWSWLMNNRRLQLDYERDPIVTEGFIWAAHSRYLLRRLTAN